MGGCVLTNDKSDSTRENILAVFAKKGMTKFTVIELGNYRLFYFNKINLPDANHIFEDGTNRVVGIGTFAYRGHFGYSALESLYHDLSTTDDRSAILNNIKGHFNIILFLNGELEVIADRTGAYHSFIGRDGNNIYVSNSFYVVAENLSHHTVRKQEMMEFIITEAIYGPNTLFEEIEYLEFGQIHNFSKNGEIISSKYHKERTVKEGYSLEDHYNAIVEYLSFMKDVDLSISSDLTAGYDSRQVCAILKHLGIKHSLNTNYNSWDTTDLKIAEAIAKGDSSKLCIYQKDLTRIPYEELLEHSLSRNELYREAFQAAYSYVFFDDKTKDFNMILGGYGGELYRHTKYHGISSIDALIDSKYAVSGMMQIFKPNEIQEFKAGLAKKMKTIVNHDDNHLSKMDCEKIYYFLRMMYWGGSRITYFNYYGYRYHPLLDYELIYPLFQIDASEKNSGKFQMQIIERFDFGLASHQSNYGHNFIWEEAKHHKSQQHFHSKVLRHLAGKLRRSTDASGTTSWRSEEDRTIWSKFVSDDLLILEFFPAMSLKGDELNLGRVYTVEIFLERYKSKIKDLL